MGIQSSLYSGISGLNTNGTAMTVIGNNIANTNTMGFKTSRTVFSDLMSSAVSGSGGTSMIGRGVGLSSVDTVFSQGTFESTESSTDLAIEGEGFFIVSEAGTAENSYTRAGAFTFDNEGYMVNPEGYRVQGYALNSSGDIVGDLTDIKVASQGYNAANPTSAVTISTNLNSLADLTSAIDGTVTGTGTTIPALSTTLTDPGNIITPLEINGTKLTTLSPEDVGGDGQQCSAKKVAAAITLDIPGVTATASATTFDLGVIDVAAAGLTLAGGNLTINGVAITGALTDGTEAADLADLINAATIPGSVTATVNAGAITLTASDGSNIQLETGGGLADAVAANFDMSGGASAQTTVGNVNITGTGLLTVNTGIDAATYGITIAADTYGVLAGEFDANNPTITSNYATSIRVYDSLGDTHLMSNYFTKTGDNTWEVNTIVAGSEIGSSDDFVIVGTKALTFNPDGTILTDPATLTTTAGILTWANGSTQSQQITFALDTSQYASESVAGTQTQDGYGSGSLTSLEVDSDGNIFGNYSNGEPRALARLALAKFGNTGGLTKSGTNLYSATTDSGDPTIGTVGSGVGKLYTNSLEQSNVDLAQEFVKMITIQRGFQANSKIITTTDEMMGELINLKR